MRFGNKSLVGLLFLALVGCSDLSSNAPPAAPTAASAAAPTAIITTDATATTSSASAPQEPTVTSTTGAIAATLLDETGLPIADLGVFLATISAGPTSDTSILSFSLNEAKRGISDQQGRFVINDVAPGTYSLAILTPLQTSLIPEPGQPEGSAIEVKVQAGQVTKLGDLKIKRPR
jgi:hypothetical protein